jgi:hypothetical protein
MAGPAVTPAVRAQAAPIVEPPPRWLWGYRLLGLRVPPPYRPWVADHLRSDGAVRTLAVLRFVGVLPYSAVLIAIAMRDGGSLAGLYGGLTGALVGSLLFVGRRRAQELAFQRVDAGGRPVPPRGWGRLDNDAMVLSVAVPMVAFLGVFSLVLRGD